MSTCHLNADSLTDENKNLEERSDFWFKLVKMYDFTVSWVK